jgi:hypothetical protein
VRKVTFIDACHALDLAIGHGRGLHIRMAQFTPEKCEIPARTHETRRCDIHMTFTMRALPVRPDGRLRR